MSKDFENNSINGEPNNFGLPDGYFKKSADSIFNKIEWIEEHKPYKRLTELKEKNNSGFIVPENYFDNLERKLELIAYPKLSTVKKQSGFIVPDNYFEDQEINELAKTLKDGNERASFKNLAAIKKENPFAVEDNYFTESAERITSALTTKPVKVIKLFGAKTWYSAAAAIVAVTIGIWIYNQYFKVSNTEDCGTLACVDKVDLVKTKNLENLESDELYELVDTKKLEEKLEVKSNRGAEKKEADTSLKNVDTEDLLDEI